jgi:hypothetical protein
LYTRKLAGKYKKVELLKPLPGSKPRILLLTDYTLVRGAKVDSAYELWGMSLKEANIADFKRLCFQKDNKSKKTMIKQIFEICAKNNPQRPDYIFFAFGGAFNLFPDPLIWRILLNVCPTPMFALLADSEQKFIKYLENIPQLKGVVSIDAATPCQKSLL